MAIERQGDNRYEEMMCLHKAAGNVGVGLLAYPEAGYERRSQAPDTVLY